MTADGQPAARRKPRFDGLCPRCGVRPNHVTRGGHNQSYCLACIMEVRRAKRQTPEGRAWENANCRARRERKRQAQISDGSSGRPSEQRPK